MIGFLVLGKKFFIWFFFIVVVKVDFVIDVYKFMSCIF